MANYTTKDIRNIALVGHGNTGKTTLIEALLCQARVINQAGTIARGTTVSDFDSQEHHNQHTKNLH